MISWHLYNTSGPFSEYPFFSTSVFTYNMAVKINFLYLYRNSRTSWGWSNYNSGLELDAHERQYDLIIFSGTIYWFPHWTLKHGKHAIRTIHLESSADPKTAPTGSRASGECLGILIINAWECLALWAVGSGVLKSQSKAIINSLGLWQQECSHNFQMR